MACRVHYLSPLIPPEWIHAHGLEPVCLAVSAPAKGAPPEGVCPFAWAAMSQPSVLPPDEAVILAAACDQLRRAAELLPPASPRRIVLHLPATTHGAARDFYRAEIQRLGRFLCALGGAAPAPATLAEAMRTFEARRRDLLPTPAPVRPRFLLLGTHLRQADRWLHDTIASLGGTVALDATDSGPRAWPRPYSPEALAIDPFAELTDAYFSVATISRRPDQALIDYLHREIPAHKIDAVLVVRYLWCDLLHALLGRLRETLPVPVLEIDLAGDTESLACNRTRIESLVESLL